MAKIDKPSFILLVFHDGSIHSFQHPRLSHAYLLWVAACILEVQLLLSIVCYVLLHHAYYFVEPIQLIIKIDNWMCIQMRVRFPNRPQKQILVISVTEISLYFCEFVRHGVWVWVNDHIVILLLIINSCKVQNRHIL